MAKDKHTPDKNNTRVKNQTKPNIPVKQPEEFNGNRTEPTGNGLPTPRIETYSCVARLQDQFSHIGSRFILPRGGEGLRVVLVVVGLQGDICRHVQWSLWKNNQICGASLWLLGRHHSLGVIISSLRIPSRDRHSQGNFIWWHKRDKNIPRV